MELNFTLLYFFAAGIASLPLPLLVRKRPLNIPVLVSAFWIIQNNLFLGINTIIWRGNVDKKMLVYCDIGLALNNAAQLGQTTAIFCLARNMEYILSPATRTARQTSRRQHIDGLLCISMPTLFAAAFLCVQSNRFNIVQDIGCLAAPWISWPYIFLWYLVPSAILSLATTYALLAFQWLRMHRSSIRAVLKRSPGGLTPFQLNRLMVLVLFQASLFLVGTIYALSLFNVASFNAYANWNVAHWHFSAIYQYPSALLPDGWIRHQQLLTLETPLSAIFFFLLFGINSEVLHGLVTAIKGVEKSGRRAFGGRFPTFARSAKPLDTIASFNSKSIPQYDNLNTPTYPPPTMLPPASRTFELPLAPALLTQEGAESPHGEDSRYPSQPSIPASNGTPPKLVHGRRPLKTSIVGII